MEEDFYRDTTNTFGLAASTELAAKEKELEHLRGLVKGFTQKKGRGRKRARATTVEVSSSDDEAGPDTGAKKPKAEHATDYIEYGRRIGRFIGPFVNISAVINYGMTMDAVMSDDKTDETEVNAKLMEAWQIILERFPGFHEFLLRLSTQPVILRAVIRQITTGLEAVRQQDTSCLKNLVHLWLHKDPATALDPPLGSIKVKAHRGMAHPAFTKVLTPMEWAANKGTYKDIIEGVFPIGTELDDPAWEDVLDNALKGEIPLRAGKALFMGPDAALEGDGYHKGR
ncbi:hypothetical protein C8R43DRAFT_1121077 [Mycena crocata]|nr:hypothetical protein C8R43DRAFT_1121077 [Mycena crocata]